MNVHTDHILRTKNLVFRGRQSLYEVIVLVDVQWHKAEGLVSEVSVVTLTLAREW